MNKNNKFLLVMMMVMLTMFSITISAKEHARRQEVVVRWSLCGLSD